MHFFRSEYSGVDGMPGEGIVDGSQPTVTTPEASTLPEPCACRYEVRPFS